MNVHYSTIIPKAGKIEDYLGKPITMLGKEVGKISDVKDVENGYLLTLDFVEGFTMPKKEPFSFSISGDK